MHYPIATSQPSEIGISITDNIAEAPDLCLRALEETVGHHLSLSEYVVAKRSVLELIETKDRIVPLDLKELWSDSPELSEFAAMINKVILCG
ncbi:hypothetical protein S7335_104 [Synechococcus sp. PCC 7335]|uniref:hypothetical protein n=1 Tax=Synechococcus sp. (strain ATCC 29403 / PCC 7335) TaxID=91464 RepID=UPI00017EB541|nr:hypothetical protein [Synechococcus sp. PCC 7335]EDX82926.1 hypothetical protein S7335_104 [Synechococcus sp. PCC 7335]